MKRSAESHLVQHNWFQYGQYCPAGSELQFTDSLHRIDEELLKKDLIAAGFEFVAASDILRNPDDDLESSWFEDTPTRKSGYQDRFVQRFRKPE